MNLSGVQRLVLLLAAMALACSGRSDRYESRYGAPEGSAAASGSDAVNGGSVNGGGSENGGAGKAGSGATSTSGEPGFAGAAEGGALAGTAGAGGADGGSSQAGAAGESVGGLSGSGGVAGSGGASGGMAGGMSGGAACSLPADCPFPQNRCIVPTCPNGTCNYALRPAGAVSLPGIPADCHRTIACGVEGDPTVVLDQSNAPAPPNPCLIGTCNSAGVPGTQPRPARTPCTVDGGSGAICDGAGKCVECLISKDCPGGLSCSKEHQCVAESCTDVDCGGPCPVCALDKKCLIDWDCQSGACDAISLTCIADHCADHRQDASETDVDCGGTFPCPRCTLGQKCNIQYDCDNLSCDIVLHQCVADHCTDHAPDVDETDLDCGGPNACARCGKFKLCKATSDCENGLTCQGNYCG